MAVLPPDPVFMLKGDMGYVHSMAYLTYERDYSRSLLAATEAGFIYLWDLESNRIKYKQQMGESIQAVHSVDKNVITQEKSGVLKSWFVRESSYEIDNTASCYGGYCKSLVLDDYIFVPEEKGKVGILDLDLQRIGSLKPTDENVGITMCLEQVTIKEKDYVLAGYESGDLILFDVAARKECAKLRLKTCVTSVGFDGATRRAVVGGASSHLDVIAVDAGPSLTRKAEINTTGDGVGVVRIRPDKKILVCGGWDGRLRLFSWRTLRTLAVLVEHKKAITDIQFSPHVVDYWGSNVMAASSGDGTISLWNLYN